MSNLQRRIGNLEYARNPPGAPLVVWEGAPMPSEAEAAGREIIIVRWLRPDEAPQASGVNRHGNA